VRLLLNVGSGNFIGLCNVSALNEYALVCSHFLIVIIFFSMIIIITTTSVFSALMLLVVRQEGHLASKN